MLKIFSEPPAPAHSHQGGPLLALGFRPFFLAASLSGVLLVALWLLIWSGHLDPGAYYGSSIGWHSHEMLFGYTVAVIAGFLLTAVRNWTGINTPSGTRLGLLLLAWLAGRIAPALEGLLPGVLMALLDLLFLPALALAIRPMLWAGKQKSNRLFVYLLLGMALANLLIHLQALGLG
ncbi:MAG: hypothetical protein B0D86_02460, partial [Candidatus Sedimenticola endophacoides]